MTLRNILKYKYGGDYMETYTTGELASVCHVSIRTIQYYDKENILKPTSTSSGGRRVYSDMDKAQLECICLYKELGFSLQQIRDIQTKQEYATLLATCSKQLDAIACEMTIAKNRKLKLELLQEQLHNEQAIKILSLHDLAVLLEHKTKHKKTTFFTNIMLVCFMGFIPFAYWLASQAQGVAYAIVSFIIVLLLLVLVYYHQRTNAYYCPNCHTTFHITFRQDLLTLNNGKKGKRLKCPHCAHQGWFREV